MRLILSGLVFVAMAAHAQGPRVDSTYARDPQQSVDDAYGRRSREYTTDPQFNSPLTNYLPASATVPTPAKVLGDVAGAPNMLPYSKDVVPLLRPARRSESAREGVPHRQERGRPRHDRRRDRRRSVAGRPEGQRRASRAARRSAHASAWTTPRPSRSIAQSTPVYYITGTIHSPETGAPTALMELAYRLAVDDAPYIKKIRSHVITLITPVVEVDGRDRMVDLYNWHRANPGKTPPPLLYWGHYVAHDNNRDAMGLTLNLSRNVLDTYLGWHAQVLHDLHESVPFLYDNTVGDGPYNAWVDPILVGEWQQLGWDNVQELTKFGMPGVFTHGDFDTWSPGYLMFMAAMHNGISRLYETFGNGGADTRGTHPRPERIRAHLVSAEPAAAEGALVAARQQQLRADRPAHGAELLRRQRQDCSCTTST